MDYDRYEDPLTGGNNFHFSEKTIRMAFVRRVFVLLSAQLTLTFGVVAALTLTPAAKGWLAANPAVFWVALAGSLVTLLALACVPNLRRRHPHNLLALALFTGFEAVVVGVASASFTTDEVLTAVAVCLLVTIALTLFALQTRIDFTMMGGMLFVAVIVLVVFGFLTIFFQNRIANLVYSCLGALIFSLYLVFDVQLMLGGKHKYSISPEEYVFATLNLYLDVVNLFTYILSIVGSLRD